MYERTQDLTNHEVLTDSKILQIAEKENDIDDEESGSLIISKVSPLKAVNALNTVLQWTEDHITWYLLVLWYDD